MTSREPDLFEADVLIRGFREKQIRLKNSAMFVNRDRVPNVVYGRIVCRIRYRPGSPGRSKRTDRVPGPNERDSSLLIDRERAFETISITESLVGQTVIVIRMDGPCQSVKMFEFWPDQSEEMNLSRQCADGIRSSAETKQKNPVTRMVGSREKAVGGADIFPDSVTDSLVEHPAAVLSNPSDFRWISQRTDTRIIESDLTFAPLQRAEKSQNIRRIGSDIVAGAVAANDDIFVSERRSRLTDCL